MKLVIFSALLLPNILFAQAQLVDQIKLSRKDLVLSEKITALMKVSDEGYFNASLTKEVKKEVSSSPNFKPFVKWVESLEKINSIKGAAPLSQFCTDSAKSYSDIPIENSLENRTNHFCRERALELIGREVEKSNKLESYAHTFIKENLKYLLAPPHQKTFSYFLQSQSSRPDIVKLLSADITQYSIKNQTSPSHEVLQDILIDDQITGLIQEKGFKPLEGKNVFYQEYSKLIEASYKVLNAPTVNADKLKQQADFLINYLSLNKSYLPLNLSLVRLSDFGKASYRLGFLDLSRRIFSFIVKQNDRDTTLEAFFFHLWTFIEEEDLKNALKFIKREDLIELANKNKDSQLRYWIAYLYEKDKNTKDALSLYESIIQDSPLSYYAIISSKRLLALKPDSTFANFYHIEARRSVTSSLTIEDFKTDHLASLVRLKAWSKIDNSKMIDLELRRLNTYSIPLFLELAPVEKHADYKETLHLLQAQIIQSSQNYLMTFRYIYNLLDNKEVRFTRNILELLYPKPYFDILKKNLKNEDPLILLSLIRQESVFNPQARSPVGARGLMQLMPATAKHMKRSVRVDQLSNPNINIQLGTKYFQGLMKRYDNNLVYVLSAYNAGETRVTRWRKQYFNEEETIVRNVETIPFKETRSYVKLIFRNLFFYKLLLNEELIDNTESNKIFNVELGFKK